MPAPSQIKPVKPFDLSPQRLRRITVCTRPFRASGPRVERTSIGTKPLIHNYGHGGSGWSLSWGCAEEVIRLARNPKSVAVIGAGAMGLTTALRLAEAGSRVTIYAEAFGRDTRSARATGSWSPDSRIAMKDAVAPGFAERWESWARTSHARHLSLVGEGSPLSFTERFLLSDTDPAPDTSAPFGTIKLEPAINDLQETPRPIVTSQHGFATACGKRTRTLTFDVGGYIDLIHDALDRRGVARVLRTFDARAELEKLSEDLIVNCTGFGAKALFDDPELVPIRGQIAWLPPHDGPAYGIHYRGGNAIARPDGIVIQNRGPTDAWGYGLDDEVPDEEEFRSILDVLRSAFADI